MKVRARSSWQRRSAYIALGVLSLLLVVFIGFAAWQGKKMVTNPHATRDMPKESPRDFGLPEQEVVVKNSDGMHLVGWWLQSRNGRYVIAQHGYKDTRDQMLNEAAMLVKHGYGVLVSTVRAHDKSEGEAISFGVRETDDLAAWFRLIKEKEPGATVCLLGNSMGGAVALEYAAINPEIKAVVANSPFSSLTDTIDVSIRYFLGLPPFPFSPLVRFFGEYFADMDSQSVDAKRSVAKIAPRAVFLMQGGRDIAISRDSGPKLYAAAGEPKVLWEEPELGHIQFDTRMPEEYERRVVGFLDQYCRP